MKKKFFMHLSLGLFIDIFCVLDIAFFIYFLFFMPSSNPLGIIELVITVVMGIVIPFFIIIVVTYALFAVFEISETGIEQRLFGILQKSVKWEEIAKITIYQTSMAQSLKSQSMTFYKTRADGLKYRRKDKITMYLNESKMAIVKEFATEEVINMMDAAIINTHN